MTPFGMPGGQLWNMLGETAEIEGEGARKKIKDIEVSLQKIEELLGNLCQGLGGERVGEIMRS